MVTCVTKCLWHYLVKPGLSYKGAVPCIRKKTSKYSDICIFITQYPHINNIQGASNYHGLRAGGDQFIS